MTDIRLFRIKGQVEEVQSKLVTLEKELRNLIEQNFMTFLGVESLLQIANVL